MSGPINMRRDTVRNLACFRIFFLNQRNKNAAKNQGECQYGKLTD